jgi:hypothetical protein
MALFQRQDVGTYIGVEFCQAVVAPGAVTTNSGGNQVVTPTTTNGGAASGCAVGDIVQLSIPTASIGALLVNAVVTAPGTITITWRNDSGGTITVTSSTWTFLIQRLVPYGD